MRAHIISNTSAWHVIGTQAEKELILFMKCRNYWLKYATI